MQIHARGVLSSVDFVAEDGSADVREVDAELVSAAGLWLEHKQRIMAVVVDHLVLCERCPALRVGFEGGGRLQVAR